MESKESLLQDFLAPSVSLRLEDLSPFRLELPKSLSMVHDVFHVSQLKQCVKHPEHAVDLGAIQLSLDLSYPERPIRVLETSQRKTRNKTVKFMKVQWSHLSEKEATWEREGRFRSVPFRVS